MVDSKGGASELSGPGSRNWNPVEVDRKAGRPIEDLVSIEPGGLRERVVTQWMLEHLVWPLFRCLPKPLQPVRHPQLINRAYTDHAGPRIHF